MNKFYNKSTIDLEWKEMLSSANAYFDTFNQKKYTFHQCIVLCTDEGKLIVCPINTDSVDKLKIQSCSYITQLVEGCNINKIKKIVCMWENKDIDVPSYEFMKKLCKLNKENEKTVILLNSGTDTYITKQISNII